MGGATTPGATCAPATTTWRPGAADRPSPPGGLPALPPTVVERPPGLHAVAEHVCSPARHAASGKIGPLHLPGLRHALLLGGRRRTAGCRSRGAALVVGTVAARTAIPLATLAAAADVARVPLSVRPPTCSPTTTADWRMRPWPWIGVRGGRGGWFGVRGRRPRQLRAGAPADPPAGYAALASTSTSPPTSAATSRHPGDLRCLAGRRRQTEPYSVLPGPRSGRGRVLERRVPFTGALLHYRGSSGVGHPRRRLAFFRREPRRRRWKA